MITKEKVLKVVARLKTVESMANKKGGFDMSEPDVDFDNKGHPCGTTHCLAGLYLVANYKRANLVDYNGVDYSEGAILMANDLGFREKFKLMNWLDEHPKEWGNDYGGSIFAYEKAFNYSGFSGAIKHFEEFAGRLK